MSSDDPEELKQQALEWITKGVPARARELLERAFRRSPGRADLALRVGLARLEAGDVPGALEAYQAALDLSPSPELIQEEAIVPIDDLLTRRTTFWNARKIRKSLLEGKPLKLRWRQPARGGPPEPRS